MKDPIFIKDTIPNNNYTVSLNNLIKLVKEHVRINFILLMKDKKMKID